MNNQDLVKETAWLLSEKYQGVESDAFHADCARLLAGEPLGYVIGHVPFLNTTIHLDSHPLIPRPETEFWTEKAIAEIKHIFANDTPSNLRGQTPKILDLCAGSGAIGVAVTKALPEAFICFAEIDSIHLPTIKNNITANLSTASKVSGNMYTIVQSDLFENVVGTFDFIVTNPPYIDVAANTVDPSVTLHEPHLALFGGVAGMEIIARIITDSPHYLTPKGQLWIEHEPVQSTTILDLATTTGFATAVTHPDQYGVLRFSVLTMAQ